MIFPAQRTSNAENISFEDFIMGFASASQLIRQHRHSVALYCDIEYFKAYKYKKNNDIDIQ